MNEAVPANRNETDMRRERILREVQRIAWFMDTAIGIPGTRFRLGFDSIVGLIPGGGDAAGLVVSLYIVYRARQLGVSGKTMARMIANAALDSAIGAIPLAGDVFDAVFKANRRNLDLLMRECGQGEQAAPHDAGRR